MTQLHGLIVCPRVKFLFLESLQITDPLEMLKIAKGEALAEELEGDSTA
ncbi:hypothetical protein [Pelotalea chapellei]|uniref:Uncharacterized protein n=1 Tax=Pelotalea chapellei TaxID=44671 RepID=A0ABS5U5Q7_9BACT|nr:hypothetical protein [Pelotalea chapellei]MBT1070989.1 hypothetical protein [Pelotalea chapellei]